MRINWHTFGQDPFMETVRQLCLFMKNSMGMVIVYKWQIILGINLYSSGKPSNIANTFEGELEATDIFLPAVLYVSRWESDKPSSRSTLVGNFWMRHGKEILNSMLFRLTLHLALFPKLMAVYHTGEVIMRKLFWAVFGMGLMILITLWWNISHFYLRHSSMDQRAQTRQH